MKLNHTDLQVTDIALARQFFEANFGLHTVYTRGDQIALLEDGHGFRLGVSNLHGAAKSPVYPQDFHIGFQLDAGSDVRSAYERLRQAGVAIRYELHEGHGHVYFMCSGPDNIAIEVSGPVD